MRSVPHARGSGFCPGAAAGLTHAVPPCGRSRDDSAESCGQRHLADSVAADCSRHWDDGRGLDQPPMNRFRPNQSLYANRRPAFRFRMHRVGGTLESQPAPVSGGGRCPLRYVAHPLTRAFSSLVGIFLVWLISSVGSSAALVEADDPRYGAKTLTIDTRTGLVWLDLPVSSGFSYLQAAEATQPGGLFEGFTHATVEKLFALYRGAGIAGPGWYPESSSSLQPILSLVSLVGATSSQDGRPEAFGISGIGVNGWHWGVGLDFIYLDGVPGYVEQTGICMGDTTRSAEWGNWLVQPIPEPSSWRLGLLAVLAFLGTRLLTGRHHDAPNEPPPSLAVGNSDGFGGRRSVS